MLRIMSVLHAPAGKEVMEACLISWACLGMGFTGLGGEEMTLCGYGVQWACPPSTGGDSLHLIRVQLASSSRPTWPGSQSCLQHRTPGTWGSFTLPLKGQVVLGFSCMLCSPSCSASLCVLSAFYFLLLPLCASLFLVLSRYLPLSLLFFLGLPLSDFISSAVSPLPMCMLASVCLCFSPMPESFSAPSHCLEFHKLTSLWQDDSCCSLQCFEETIHPFISSLPKTFCVLLAVLWWRFQWNPLPGTNTFADLPSQHLAGPYPCFRALCAPAFVTLYNHVVLNFLSFTCGLRTASLRQELCSLPSSQSLAHGHMQVRCGQHL